MSRRYDRQIQMVGEDGQCTLGSSHAVVVGCGGLGSSVISALTCAGVGHLTLIDGDIVSESNLNRQFIHAGRIGMNKAESAASWVRSMDPSCVVTAIGRYLGDCDASVLADADIVLDCLDNIRTRLLLADMCSSSGKVLVHCAVDSFYGQVAVIRPGGALRMEDIYQSGKESDSHPSMAPYVMEMGALEAQQAVSVLLGWDDALDDEILSVDMRTMSMTRYPVRRR
ncbi:MAG: HesA/MoeB/ThiF family protein [Candidatus Methanomethylophilaceae archaeon]